VRARGDERGLVEQTLVAPKALLLPATLTFGWPLFRGEREVDVYVLDANGPIGAVEKAAVTTAGGLIMRRPKHHIVTRTMGYDVSIDSALNVPVSVNMADGSERRLLDMKGTLPRGQLVAPASGRP